jgi:hypothetical protein
MNKNCKQCGDKFEITDSDLKFYDKVSTVIEGKKYPLPTPTLCPDCRQQRRLTFRNERHLHKRKCDLCGKQMLSIYGNKVLCPIYCVECWWSDKWDPIKYGRDFDFNRPFFDQFKELLSTVPKMGLLQLNNENCEYNTLISFSKNTYLSPGSYFMEDSMYCRKSQNCKDCLDVNALDDCELMKSSTNCNKCYNCHDLINCRNCSNCEYMADSTGCKDCFMCSAITKKQYCVKNKQYSKSEYEELVSEKKEKLHEDLLKEFFEFNKTIPKRYQNQLNCENSSGDYIQNCKNSIECYDCFNDEDCKYMIESVGVKDSMDNSMHDKEVELCYEVASGGDKDTLVKFSFCPSNGYGNEYTYSCFYPQNCFGCDSINSKKKYCILNKQYSEKEYNKLKGKIIEHMMKTGEYGEFFPPSLSLHPYNETTANDYFPMKEKGPREYEKSEIKVPKRIEDAKEDIVDKILSCEKCGKNYKILQLEFNLCKRMKTPLSTKCPDCRMHDLSELKNPRKLWGRKCDNCGDGIETTYSSDKPEKVYCEECYLKMVY